MLKRSPGTTTDVSQRHKVTRVSTVSPQGFGGAEGSEIKTEVSVTPPSLA